MTESAGKLVLVATPIGNLGDLSPRAAEALRAADAVYCEDTRRTRQLLTHTGITQQKLVSLHEHNEGARTGLILEELAQGRIIAVVSDAGMPVISDPGGRLVAAVAEAGFTVSAVPGANAALMALAISGLDSERFCFEGFLPGRGAERKARLAILTDESRTIVLYESPHRLGKTVADLTTISGSERRIVLARELTKLYEEVWRGTLTEAAEYVATTPPRGEYTLVLEGAKVAETVVSDGAIIEALETEITTGVSRRSAIDSVTEALDIPRKRVYTLALAIDSKQR